MLKEDNVTIEKLENTIKAIDTNISQITSMVKQLETKNEVTVENGEFDGFLELTLFNLYNFKHVAETVLEGLENEIQG